MSFLDSQMGFLDSNEFLRWLDSQGFLDVWNVELHSCFSGENMALNFVVP